VDMSDQSTRPRRKSSGVAWALVAAVTVMATATTDASGAPMKKPTASVGPVSSTGQHSGVTAGYVNQLTQTVLPSLVRGPQLEKFKAIFTDGAKLKRDFMAMPVDDAKIDALTTRADKWANETFSWLKIHVSEYAAERFLFRPPGNSYSYNLPGEHAAGYVDRWGNTQMALSSLLINLDQLMRDPSIYPDATAK
jgi:hypothetical protein